MPRLSGLPLAALFGSQALLLTGVAVAHEPVQNEPWWKSDPAALTQSRVAHGAPFSRYTPRSQALRAPSDHVARESVTAAQFTPIALREAPLGYQAERRARARAQGKD